MIERIELLTIVASLSAMILAGGNKLIKATDNILVNEAVEVFEEQAGVEIDKIIKVEELENTLRNTDEAIKLLD